MTDTFLSHMEPLGRLSFPAFSGVRVMMLPIRLEDPGTWPAALIGAWADPEGALATLVSLAPVKTGVAYLTVDEATVPAGKTHRRPGLHVDGVGPEITCVTSALLGGVWGGGTTPGGWGGRKHQGFEVPVVGWLTAASVPGCMVWPGTFHGRPRPDGDCSHLASQCDPFRGHLMVAGEIYGMGPLAVHESVPMLAECNRQFVRLSMPSDAPWYEGYTENPLGVWPTGPIHPRRSGMGYRP